MVRPWSSVRINLGFGSKRSVVAFRIIVPVLFLWTLAFGF